MSNHILSIDFCGVTVRAQTEGHLVCLNDLIAAGNHHRAMQHLPLMRVQQIVKNLDFGAYVAAASRVWGRAHEQMLTTQGRGGQARTMAHVAVAVFVAEKMSPEFHAQVIKTFIEGKLLEFRELGGTEFKALNAAIDAHLPGREEKASNLGVYVNAAKALRSRVLGPEAAGPESWGTATVAQTHERYDLEKALVRVLAAGVVRDWPHLKELIQKL